MNSNQDEFDVESTLKSLYSLIIKAFLRLIYPVRIVFHKPAKLAIALIMAFALSFGLNKVLTPIYHSSFSLKPILGDDTFFLNQLNDLHRLVKDKDAEQLAGQLKISVPVAEAIYSLDTKVVWKNTHKDTVKLVMIQLKSKNRADFLSVQQALHKYLETSEHYARLKAMRQMQITRLHEKLNEDIKEIDSIKGLLTQTMLPRNAGGFVYGEPLDPVKLYDAGLNLYRQQIALSWQQEYINSFEVTSPCVVSKKPYWPRLSYLFAASGLLVCIVVGWHNHQNKNSN